ncbi:hypothetical protein F2Q69_00002967 [Brassica cretica]|uniref:CHHC U11-48K-type domain-containing protein n=1 Tax=Brassica cretica TaxID=69181 RepID=A0A8S9NW81_BRACR|nr:hypothetical protein F2Q69_00002967 [Brassica cretica]
MTSATSGTTSSTMIARECKTRRFTLPSVLSVECSEFEGSEAVETSELRKWILVNSSRYGVIIDTYMRDHVFLLFRLSMKAVVKEASGFMREYDANAAGEQSCKSRSFECCLVSASRIMLFWSPESSGVLKDLDEDLKIGKALDTSLVISVSLVAAAVAALFERYILEGKMRAIRYAQPLTRYQRMAELGAMTTKADEERTGRPNYRPIIDHDGLPRQRLSNQDMNKMKTREDLLAEERDYKRRRMSYRGKKVKRTPPQVLSDMIEEFTEEVKLAGGIGCLEKGMPLHSSSSISQDQKEIDLGYNSVSTTLTDASPRSYQQRKGENSEYAVEIRTKTDKGKRYEEYDSGSSQSHRSYKRSDRRDDEFTRTRRSSHERESYHQNHRSSREKSSSDYSKDDRYDSRYSREPRKQNSFEDRYNPLERY